MCCPPSGTPRHPSVSPVHLCIPAPRFAWIASSSLCERFICTQEAEPGSPRSPSPLLESGANMSLTVAFAKCLQNGSLLLSSQTVRTVSWPLPHMIPHRSVITVQEQFEPCRESELRHCARPAATASSVVTLVHSLGPSHPVLRRVPTLSTAVHQQVGTSACLALQSRNTQGELQENTARCSLPCSVLVPRIQPLSVTHSIAKSTLSCFTHLKNAEFHNPSSTTSSLQI